MKHLLPHECEAINPFSPLSYRSRTEQGNVLYVIMEYSLWRNEEANNWLVVYLLKKLKINWENEWKSTVFTCIIDKYITLDYLKSVTASWIYRITSTWKKSPMCWLVRKKWNYCEINVKFNHESYKEKN